jgi:hypothetical protein
MKRILSLAVALLLVAGTAFGWPLARVWKGGPPWWSGGLTFWAPFEDPADPLKLNVGTGTLSFTRATTATYVHPTTGLITSAASGQLRIEANGALVEGQRTNLALQSEALGNATNWTATNVTVDNNTVQAPTGDNTAETLTATDATGSVLSSITGTVASYTFSAYLKRKTGTGNVSVSADNTTGTVCTINASTWTCCSDTATLSVAAYFPGIHIATSGDAVYAFGGDAELGTFASSYIKTTTAAVTRNADVLTFASSGNISGTVGTIALTYDKYAAASVLQYLIKIGTDSYFGINGSTSYSFSDGTNPSALSTSTAINTTYKGVITWGTNKYMTVDGAGEGSVLTFDGDMNLLANPSIGDIAGSIRSLWGHIKHLRIWDRQFDQAQRVTISTP